LRPQTRDFRFEAARKRNSKFKIQRANGKGFRKRKIETGNRPSFGFPFSNFRSCHNWKQAEFPFSIFQFPLLSQLERGRVSVFHFPISALVTTGNRPSFRFLFSNFRYCHHLNFAVCHSPFELLFCLSRPLTWPATAGESAVVGQPLPKGQGCGSNGSAHRRRLLLYPAPHGERAAKTARRSRTCEGAR
jgi:hypothetical protein